MSERSVYGVWLLLPFLSIDCEIRERFFFWGQKSDFEKIKYPIVVFFTKLFWLGVLL